MAMTIVSARGNFLGMGDVSLYVLLDCYRGDHDFR